MQRSSELKDLEVRPNSTLSGISHLEDGAGSLLPLCES